MSEKAFEVLAMLEDREKPLSGEEIAEGVELHPAELEPLFEELEKFGYKIDSSDGYLLKERSPYILPYELRRHLRTRFIGQKALHHDVVPSTLNIAMELADNVDPASLHGLVVLAEEQTGGKGRMNREWHSPRGGIWATIILKPEKIPVDRLFMIIMAGSVAIARAIRRELGIGALIKWPNDIFIGSKKVAGLLQKNSLDEDDVNYVLLGFGLNVNVDVNDFPAAVRPIAVSLDEEAGETLDRNRIMARVLKEFELRFLQLEEGEYDTILQEWKSICLSMKRRVQIKTFRKTVRGEAVGIDRNGALLVRKDNGVIEKVFAGDIF